MVAACLAAHLAPAQDLHLALSGGRDSVVLLHILHGLLPGRLRAIHVHHGLSPHADEWARFCADACRALDVPLEIRVVRVEKRGRGLEAAARAARYRAFLDSGASILALAHHRRDQAETLLLNLCRGAGVSGAAGMPPRHALQQSDRRLILLRPLLHADARDILAYAQAHRLAWVEDESNADIRYRRNFLRARIFPELATRFPAIDATLSRAAGHFAETEELLAELAALDEAHTGGRIQALRGLSPARQANWMRQRLKKLGWHLPDANALAEILRQLAQVRDADNHFRHLLPEGSLYLWQDRLHCVPDV
ncbi:MAG: tRNA lysidine(34) synthetase TilS, partial [Zoogloeaceae bacterium]|nr:tRNA lysidine(34) synthetase TilS [Zoogloeaceae bacterium]